MSLHKEEYLDIITSGASLTALCETTAQAIGNPVALTLPTRTIIARSRDYNQELLEEYTGACEDMTEEEQADNYDMIRKRLMTRRAFIGIYPYLRHKHMNCGCFWKGNLIAVLDIPIINKIIIEDTLHMLDEVAAIFTPAIVLNGGIPNGVIDPMEPHLIALLKGEIQPNHEQTFRYNIPLRQIDSWNVIWTEPVSPALISDIVGQVYAFCSNRPYIWCTRWAEGLVILVDADKIDQVYELERSIPDAIFSVSETFEELLNLSSMFHQAKFALHLAQYEMPDTKIAFAKNYKIPIFFLSHTQNAPRQEYKSFLLEQIKEYDIAHNSTYFETLRAYLLNNMDMNRIAAALNVHRNTASYRLQRMEELFEINLSDCRVITELYLSLFTDGYTFLKGNSDTSV